MPPQKIDDGNELVYTIKNKQINWCMEKSATKCWKRAEIQITESALIAPHRQGGKNKALTTKEPSEKGAQEGEVWLGQCHIMKK